MEPTSRWGAAELSLHEPADGAELSLHEPLLKPADAAELLAVRQSWIYEAVRAGQLPCLKLGRHIRFTRSMLERWLAAQAG